MKPLLPVDDQLAWHTLPWPAYQKESPSLPAIAVLPVCPLVDQGNDLPLDVDEQFLWTKLLAASEAISTNDASQSIRILPPFRQAPNILPGIVFGTGILPASQALIEIAESVQRSNVSKIAFIHTNRALGDWIDTVARELRIESNLQAFNLFLDPAEGAQQPPLVDLLREALAFPNIIPFTPEAH